MSSKNVYSVAVSMADVFFSSERLMPLRPVTQFVVTAGACAV